MLPAEPLWRNGDAAADWEAPVGPVISSRGLPSILSFVAPQGRTRSADRCPISGPTSTDQTRSRGRLLRTNPRLRRLVPSNAIEAGSGISETSEINATVSTTVLPSASVHVTLPAS